ncbi:Secreted effector protein pipB2 [compost metagenome]
MLQELKVLHQYVREWLRKAVPLVIALPEFQAIDRAEVLRICTGEYKDFSETVWVDDRRPKDADELKRWLEQRLPTAYMCSDLRGLNLSGGRYEGIDLRSSHCAGSNWSDSSLHSSICISTDFSQCQMSGTDFSQSLLHDANFSGSDLRGAQFKEAVGTKRFIHEGMVLGFSGVNFTGANLQGASLLYADFHGACFEGANLSGAMLMKLVMNKWSLSEEQKQSVIWMEEDESGVPVQASGNKGSKT